MQIMYDSENSLCHYGVLGMKWGRRKSKAKSSGKKASKSNKKTKYLTDARKQKIKSVVKTTTKIAGAVAAASILGYAGSIAFSEISNALASTNIQTPQVFNQEAVRSRPDSVINRDVELFKWNPVDKASRDLRDTMWGNSSPAWNRNKADYVWRHTNRR